MSALLRNKKGESIPRLSVGKIPPIQIVSSHSSNQLNGALVGHGVGTHFGGSG